MGVMAAEETMTVVIMIMSVAVAVAGMPMAVAMATTVIMVVFLTMMRVVVVVVGHGRRPRKLASGSLYRAWAAGRDSGDPNPHAADPLRKLSAWTARKAGNHGRPSWGDALVLRCN
jgi:hypothetical protein